MGDKTYLNQPKFMSMETVARFVDKLKTHIIKHNLQQVYIAFHGGEPLLWGEQNFRQAAKLFRETIPVELCNVSLVVQTNGVLLSTKWLNMFKEEGIFVGISFDGTEDVHDLYRQDHKGKGSFTKVVRGMRLQKQINNRLAVISVINLENDADRYYSLLKELGVTDLNILLPDSHFDTLPPAYKTLEDRKKALYGKWLVRLFDLWEKDDSQRPSISFFNNIIMCIAGIEAGDQLIGSRPNDAVVLESDGSIEVVDMMRVCKSGITRNTLNIKQNEIDDVFNVPIYDLYYYGNAYLCDTCIGCSYVDLCGGGMVVHRYSKELGFWNPSVYCEDLKYIIRHVQNYMIDHMGVSDELHRLSEEESAIKPNHADSFIEEKLKSFSV